MTPPRDPGFFVISLDFELFWGMTDITTLSAYGENVRGVHTAIPRMLELFTTYGIHATWATVGMLMARNHHELLSLLPHENLRPQYHNPRLSTYYHLEFGNVGIDETDDPYHYGPSLVSYILNTPHQELANHTFSHFYPLEEMKNRDEALAADLAAHARIAATYGVATTSIVFPRNQTNEETLAVCKAHGMRTYRGNENHFLYQSRKHDEQSPFIRGLRLLDHYINISGHHTYPLPHAHEAEIVNIPASRFFRPYMKSLAWLEPLRLRRIKRAMTRAAEHGEIFHLWWHPHNFGINQEENFKNLTVILEHFSFLQKTFGMKSCAMHEIYKIT